MAPPDPAVIGMIGCGLQAYAHLDAFRDLYPGLQHVLAFSRSRGSAEKLAAAATALTAAVVDDANAILTRADIVISMVPGAPGLRPFLDARRLKPVSFACAVDTGRSWMPESLPAFDMLATDSLAQSTAPYDVDGNPVTTARFETDLVQLADRQGLAAATKRSLFCFRGVSLADLALAGLVVAKAKASGRGLTLPR
jgi:alanine dehydrogenase